MRLALAFKAFLKAFKDPKAAEAFLTSQPPCIEKSQASEPSHLRLLALLQGSGRLIDFFKEDLSSFSDAQVGSAVRKIHLECGKTLEEVVTLRPLMSESEGSKVTVPQGYDPHTMKVVGKVLGDPPYQGTLVHKGWKAHKRSLPKQLGEGSGEVICPAEIEIR